MKVIRWLLVGAIMLFGCAVSPTSLESDPPRDTFAYIEINAPVVAVVACKGKTGQNCNIVVNDRGMSISASGVVVANSATHDDIQYTLTAGHVCQIEKHFKKDLTRYYKKKKGLSVLSVTFKPTLTVYNNHGQKFTAKVVGMLESSDLCIIAIRGSNVRPAVLALTTPNAGSKVWNLAAPHGIWQPHMTNKFVGYYSGDFMCTTANMSSFEMPCTPGKLSWSVYTMPATGGSSGSPIFNAHGRVIGIISMTNSAFKEITYATRLEDIRRLLNAVLRWEKSKAGLAALIHFDDAGLNASSVISLQPAQ